jgi:methylation protein EvaC
MVGYKKRKHCAISNSEDFATILDLGLVPLAGYFPTTEQVISNQESKYPLKLLLCNKSKLVQVDSIIDPDILFKDYRYMSSIGLSAHFTELANILHSKYNVKDKNILEIGCNDGVLLDPLSKLGANVEGVDPALNIVKVAREKGLSVYDTYFNYENFKGDQFKNKYDLVLANNSFAHITDICDVVKGIKHVLKPNGDFVLEVHYLKNLIDELQWDNIYHEHIYYYSVTALYNMFKQSGMTVIDFQEIPIHAGSIRVTVRNAMLDMPEIIKDRITSELVTICDKDYLHKFQTKVLEHIDEFKNQINELSKKYTIAAYGASGRANMFCNLANLNEDQIKFVVDESPERCGRYIANTKIPIVDINQLKESKVDLLIIFAWNYSKMIIKKTQFRKFKYLVAFPHIQIVNDYSELKDFQSL